MSLGPVPVARPRLARHRFTLSDGHRVGVAVSGRGVPLVVVHGFSAEAFLYAQTLHRLVRTGFRVVAIDMAGHGGTQGLPMGGAHLDDYAALMGRCVDELGIRRAVLAGHSMGGRVAAQLAATTPDRTIAAVLIDAIVGDVWDRMVQVFRVVPPLLAGVGVLVAADTVSTLPLVADRRQARKLGRLAVPTLARNVVRPWRMLGPAVSILRTPDSGQVLDELARLGMPTFVIHGERDLIVPVCTARAAAERAHGELIVVQGASHSWLLKDPETLPAIVAQLLDGRLGDAIRDELPGAGAASVDEIEALLYEPDAPILGLTPEPDYTRTGQVHRAPRYRWTVR